LATAQGSGPAEAVLGEDEDDLPWGEMSDSPWFGAHTVALLAGLVLVPGSVWLELSPARRPSLGWQVDSGGGGAATGKLQTLHHKKLCRVMSSGFNGV